MPLTLNDFLIAADLLREQAKPIVEVKPTPLLRGMQRVVICNGVLYYSDDLKTGEVKFIDLDSIK